MAQAGRGGGGAAGGQGGAGSPGSGAGSTGGRDSAMGGGGGKTGGKKGRADVYGSPIGPSPGTGTPMGAGGHVNQGGGGSAPPGRQVYSSPIGPTVTGAPMGPQTHSAQGAYDPSKMPPNADVPSYVDPSLGQIISSIGLAPTGPFAAPNIAAAVSGGYDPYGRSDIGVGIDGVTGSAPGKMVGGVDVDRDTNPGRYGGNAQSGSALNEDGTTQIASDRNALPSPLAVAMETLLEYTSKGGDPTKKSVPIQQQTAIPSPFPQQSGGVVQ